MLHVSKCKLCFVSNILTFSVINLPFPTRRLANAALQSLSVDQELSPLVRRQFELVSPSSATVQKLDNDPLRASLLTNAAVEEPISLRGRDERPLDTNASEDELVLKTTYRATTNRMLRVAVNGFFESMGVVLQVMEELDVDVVNGKGLESLERVQGVEQGLTGQTVAGC